MRHLERRHHPRYALIGKLRAREFSPLGVPRERERIIQGRLQNISAGGLELLTRQVLPASSLVRCEFLFPKVPVPTIPTLLEVRWVRENSKGQGYRVGLQFLV